MSFSSHFSLDDPYFSNDLLANHKKLQPNFYTLFAMPSSTMANDAILCTTSTMVMASSPTFPFVLTHFCTFLQHVYFIATKNLFPNATMSHVDAPRDSFVERVLFCFIYFVITTHKFKKRRNIVIQNHC